MTVASETNRVSLAGNGVTTAFAFGHPYRASSDLRVIVRTDSTGAESLKTEGADYTVSGSANVGTGGFDSGTVTFGTAPATGTTVVINRRVAATSATDPNAGAGIGAANLEGAIDRAMLAIQTVREMLARTLLLPESSPLANLALPEPKASVASNLLGVNATGNGFALYTATTLSVGQVVSAFAATLLDDADASAALTTLGLSAFVKTLMDDANAAAFLTTLGVTAYAQTLLDDANAAAARATLELGGTVALTSDTNRKIRAAATMARIAFTR